MALSGIESIVKNNFEKSLNTVKPENDSGLCECCLSSDDLETMIEPIEKEMNINTYAEMLHYCFSIKIRPNEYTPSFLICNYCIIKLRSTLLFRNQIEYAQEKIKNILHNTHSTKFSLSKRYQDIKQEDAKEDIAFDDTKQGILDSTFTKRETSEIDITSKKLFTKRIKKVSAEKLDNHKTFCSKTTSCFPNVNKNSQIRKSCDDFLQKAAEDVLSKRSKKYVNLQEKSREHILSDARKKYAKSIPYKLEKDALTCPICTETFVTNKFLVIHMSIHYPNFICDICGKSFVCRRHLSGHKRNTHTLKVPCSICKKMLKKSNMSQHLRIHRGTNQLYKQCFYCEEKFTSFTLRAKHMSDVHSINPYKYHCKLCPKNFITAGALSTHFRKYHLLSINYNCSECGKGFFERRDLNDHALTHTGVKNFQCELCQKSFARRATLIQHIKIHTNEKKHQCGVCDRSFTQKCTLKGHMKFHIIDNVISKAGRS